MHTMNHINCTTKLARAYIQVEQGDPDAALRSLRDAATYAFLEDDHARRAMILRAHATVAGAYGLDRLSIVRGD